MLQDIIKTAILGTERSFPEKEIFPSFFHPTYDKIMESDLSKESKFLKISSFVFQIQQTSTLDLKLAEEVNVPPSEKLSYISPKISKLLRNYLKKDNKLLIIYVLRMAEKSEKIVMPYDIPALLDIAYQKMDWRETIINVCGDRAQWLVQFNSRWKTIFDMEANVEKLIKKEQKKQKNAFEETFANLSRTDQFLLLDDNLKTDIQLYQYLNALMNENFNVFPADFSNKVFQILMQKYCGQNKEFYQNLALHFHSSLKLELMELTNQSHQNMGIFPNVAREMLEILLNRDDILKNI